MSQELGTMFCPQRALSWRRRRHEIDRGERKDSVTVNTEGVKHQKRTTNSGKDLRHSLCKIQCR